MVSSISILEEKTLNVKSEYLLRRAIIFNT